jgi:hypothetical protein
MRDFKGMKRQRSRNRNGGGGGKPQHNANRAFDSNGPEGVKVRGAAQHVYEKYQQLARDAQTAGDRVLAENYLQHAEHYFRLMRAMQPQRPVSDIIGRDQFVSGYDIDFEDEPVAGEAAESDVEAVEGAVVEGGDPMGERPQRFEGRRDDQSRSERPQNERFQSDRFQNDRFQGERFQGDRPRNNRDDRPRFNRDERNRDERVRDERPRSERPERDPLGVIEPEATPLTAVAAAPEPEGPMLRAEDGDLSHAPAFLQVRPSEGAEEGRRPPRRRRAPAAFAAEDAAPAAPATEES